eukprot:TRINITY_DN3207_c0_g1_i1.p1 TRINITY_DN3207_c0_g1~~TRINITY_DN3207_c0_g1_i1.p1  ORF type:complete len:367 (-),score=76.07 TRINITY_DN3207_c0_g1_i1:9-1109(-)
MKRKREESSGGETHSIKKKLKTGTGYSNIITDINTADHDNFNLFLTQPLEQLAKIEKSKGDMIRHNAYMMAAAQLKSYPKKINSGEEAKGLKGIGVKIAKKIQEIIDTGQLQRLDRDMNDEGLVALGIISGISGIGPKKAQELVYDMNIKTVEALKEAVKNGTVSLTHHALLGLKYYEDMQLRIPRDEISEIVKVVKEEVKKLDDKIVVKCCGSYRRGAATCGDIDLLLTHPKFTLEEKKKKNHFHILSKIRERLYKCGLLKHDMSSGDMKYMGLCKIGDNPYRHIDLILYPVESYFCGLCHFTGSGEHNRKLRAVALSKGMKLNEYGLYPLDHNDEPGDPFPIYSEKDLFGILGLPYRKPSQRNL